VVHPVIKNAPPAAHAADVPAELPPSHQPLLRVRPQPDGELNLPAQELHAILHDIIEHRRLHAVLQPIVTMRAGDIVGSEGLIRGPVDSPLHMPGWPLTWRDAMAWSAR
jgi:hypothetical protein